MWATSRWVRGNPVCQEEQHESGGQPLPLHLTKGVWQLAVRGSDIRLVPVGTLPTFEVRFSQLFIFEHKQAFPARSRLCGAICECISPE